MRRVIQAGLCLLAMAFSGLNSVHATTVPDAALDDLDAGGIVYSIAASADTIYIGGNFGSVGGVGRNGLVAIDRGTGTVITAWDPGFNGPTTVYALALSADGATLYAGGSFASFGSGPTTRNNIAAIDTQTGVVVSAWDPDINGVVRALALAPGGATLYAGGDFDMVGSSARTRLAAVSTTTGLATPWNPGANGTVRSLAVSPDGARVYVGGDFLIVDGQVRRRLAALLASSGAATAWNPDIDPTIATGRGVYSIALTADGDTLYIGGEFTDVDGKARSRIAALDTTAPSGSIASPWDPDADATVRALDLSYDETMIYAGGDFTQIGPDMRTRLAKVRIGDAASVPGWDPGAAIVAGSPVIHALSSDPDRGALYAGGDFDIDAGGVTKHGIAAFAVGPPVTVADPLGGGFQATSITVSLTCMDNGGGGCTGGATYFSTDGSGPDPTPVNEYNTPQDILSDTVLKFFSIDTEENSEAVRSETYVVGDTSPPSTTNTPIGGLYGIDTLQPVALLCDDGGGSGCAATYYTLDGSDPTTSSAEYTAPISLGALFPPAGIAPEDVDPLRDLAGPVTLKYFSVDAAGNSEADPPLGIHTENYFVDLAAPVVTASLVSGSYTPPQTLSITCDDGVGSGCAAMYYSLDDTTPSDKPTTDSQGNVVMPVLYTGPITLNEGAIVNVLAIDNAGNRSTTLVGIYSFSSQKGSTSGVGAFGPGMLAAVVLLLGWRRRENPRRGVSGGSAASR